MITLWHIMNYQSMEDSIKVLALCKRLFFFLEVLVHLFDGRKTIWGNSHGRFTRNKELLARELFFSLKRLFFCSDVQHCSPLCVYGLKHDSTQTCDSPEPLSMLLLFFQILMANYLVNSFKSGQFWLLSIFCVWKINVFTRHVDNTLTQLWRRKFESNVILLGKCYYTLLQKGMAIFRTCYPTTNT